MLFFILSPMLLAATPALQERGTTLDQFVSTRTAHFQAADADKDGRLTLAEWKQARSGAAGDPSRLFVVMDVDKDGALSTAEIETSLTARFAKLDADGDKLLTRSEVAAARQAKD